MMVADVCKDHEQSSKRSPLLPSEKDNSNSSSVSVSVNSKRAKAKNVSSRYMSPSPSTSTSSSASTSMLSSSSRRCPSPVVSRNSTPVSNGGALGPKRSVSADRRRPAVSRVTSDVDLRHSSGSELAVATKRLVTSTRSLSVSFQGEYYPLPISKAKVVAPSPSLSSVRRGTPERKRSGTPVRVKVDGSGEQVENAKPSDQHRWPARARELNSLSRSVDCSGGERKVDGSGEQVENAKPSDQHRWPARARELNSLSRSVDYSGGERSAVIGSGNIIRALQQSLMDERRSSFDGRLSMDLGSVEPLRVSEQGTSGNLVNNELSIASDLTASDTDSVSSGSSSGLQGSNGSARLRSGPRGIASSARFWQETNSRLRRLQDPGSPLSTSPSSKFITPSKLRKYASDNVLSSPRTVSSSPIRGGVRAASPSKLVTPRASSPSRGSYSPSRVRNAVSTINNNFTESPSVLSFSVDVRRGKVGENRIFDAHLLRLMYNRHLQWRFVNARTEESLLVQKHIVEKNLWGAWIMISNLRDTVTKKRHRLQLLKRKLKLASILKGQMKCLEEWASLDKGHCISLHGAIEALKASTLRLPVGGATVDIQSLKEAVGSAVDVMQTMLSSMHSYFPKVEEVNSLLIELASATAKERTSLAQCKGFLSNLATLEVKDCSLRSQMLQHKFTQKPTI